MPKVQIHIKHAQLKDYRAKNAPKVCPILGHSNFIPVVDHDHKTGRIRGVVSLEGNALLGKIENLYRSRCVHATRDLVEVLRALALYLEETDGGPYHPIGMLQLCKRFKAGSKRAQLFELAVLGVDAREIEACKNSKQRCKLYRQALLENF